MLVRVENTGHDGHSQDGHSLKLLHILFVPMNLKTEAIFVHAKGQPLAWLRKTTGASAWKNYFF